MHKSHDLLITQLKLATNQVLVGGFYYHYKNPKQSYKVLNLAITEADDSLCVIYEAQYGEHLIFVGPLSSWLDKINDKDRAINRFTQIKQA